MQFINPIYLVSMIYEENNIGSYSPKEEKRKVLSSISSVKQSEFYQAQISGLKPEIVFKIRSFEYKGEESVIYNNKKYDVIRTYNTLEGIIEIVCTEKIGDIDGQK
ncbi:phage head closure protein [Clostridium tertium]|uniref:phage head closure protein n=1 Tax=Clostridium TaxID=1485 RepID=UPI001ECA4CD1|nr:MULTISPECIES: phage head closure protein [Clostridium]MBS5886295.1 phage head closure protein [Clostridium sp.]MDB1943739.1 phage head closure protein [Clostridium tertium]MDB1951095.1 phage head closure protein [Clostridium tertium]MDU7148326.1 phage head closure protein [Clostridium sp.]